MGREIRRVPADWEHPRNEKGEYLSLYDQTYEEAAQEWLGNCDLWREGKHEDQAKGYGQTCKYFWEYEGGPPDEEYYRKRAWTPQEATHYQIYETVSEGSPVSPVFVTLDELRDWLVGQGYSEAAAKNFARTGYAPSLVITEDHRLLQDIEAASLAKEASDADKQD